MSNNRKELIKATVGKIVSRITQTKQSNLVAGDCWEWQGARNQEGYGVISMNAKMERNHRIMWENSYGPIPEGMIIMHLCNNPSCCNPDHLKAGTHSENGSYKAATNRNKKYSDDDVRNVMAHPTVKTTELAKQLNLPYGFIYAIRRGLTRNDITGISIEARNSVKYNAKAKK